MKGVLARTSFGKVVDPLGRFADHEMDIKEGVCVLTKTLDNRGANSEVGNKVSV